MENIGQNLIDLDGVDFGKEQTSPDKGQQASGDSSS